MLYKIRHGNTTQYLPAGTNFRGSLRGRNGYGRFTAIANLRLGKAYPRVGLFWVFSKHQVLPKGTRNPCVQGHGEISF